LNLSHAGLRARRVDLSIASRTLYSGSLSKTEIALKMNRTQRRAIDLCRAGQVRSLRIV
jgi:hypothetical protein